jgi:diguanylate cyclase (GGDEF)-like protein/PAS domain S-box-containing protein
MSASSRTKQETVVQMSADSPDRTDLKEQNRDSVDLNVNTRAAAETPASAAPRAEPTPIDQMARQQQERDRDLRLVPAAKRARDIETEASTSSSLKLRVSAGFAAVTLVFALVLGMLPNGIANVDGLTSVQAAKIRELVLWWGFGGVVLSAILGALFAKQIADPINRLTEELRAHPPEEFPWSASVHRNYSELESLSRTIQSLANSVRDRERDLLDSERKFREAFDVVGIGLTQVDTDGRFLVVNRRFCEMLGYTRDELIGKRFVDITHPEEREQDEAVIRAAQANPNVNLNREKRYIRKDGSVLWAQRSGVVVRDSAGKPMYGLGSIEDVSQYHASQDTLRALNASLKAIVETSPLAIYSVTPQGIVTLWNPAAEAMFGVRELDVLGKPSPLMLGDSRQLIIDIRQRVMAGETLHGVELTWFKQITNPSPGQTAVTERREISLAAAPLRGPENSVVGVLITCSDITAIKDTARMLDKQLHFTQELLEVIPNPIFYKGADGRYLGFNRAWEQFHLLDRNEWVGRTPTEVLTNETIDQILEEDALVLRGNKIVREVKVMDGHGSDRDIIKQISRFTAPDGTIAGLIGVLTDITDFKQVKEALQASEGRFQALTESAMDIVTVLDAEGVILYQSPSVKHLIGIEPQDMIGQNQFDLVHRDDAEAMRSQFNDLIHTGAMSKPIEFRVRARDGNWRILESIGKNCLDVPAVRGIIVNTRDVTDRRAIEQRIQHLAFHDVLTGLPNRSLMADRISHSISRAERGGKKFAVMFIDIDNFKNINDTLGHDIGDELLREVARRLSTSVRGHDTIARQGGDEFIVLLDQLENHQGAIRVAQKILDALRSAFRVGNTDQHVSGSLGIALYPEDGRDAATLLKNADTAMFHGKSLGKNTYQFFTSQMNIAVKRRAALESNLRAAVKNGDFSLAYQPQVDLISGEIVALEALVRWNSEDSGTMMPGEFIPLAEETGLINEIGEWVLREACRQNMEWQRAGFTPRRVAVNLSARQLTDKGFMESLHVILAETGHPPHLLELEITESQVMRQGEGSVMLLNEIAAMGIHLAVDDFGTGYSSLSYLKRLPIGKLKIDQSFVRDITVDPNDTAIVVAIINMSKSLDLEIIAEGIETAGQLTLLRAKGCGVGQGYYFSVPLSPRDVEPLLRRSSIFENASLAL